MRDERNIARCRLIFSVVAPLAIYLDPTEPTLLVQHPPVTRPTAIHS